MLPSHCNVNYLACGLKADIPRRVKNLITKQKVSQKDMKLVTNYDAFLGNGNTSLKDLDMNVTILKLHEMYQREGKRMLKGMPTFEKPMVVFLLFMSLNYKC